MKAGGHLLSAWTVDINSPCILCTALTW
jgi:hypothetical protein